MSEGTKPQHPSGHQASQAPGKARRRPKNQGPRISREKRTIEVMTALYCRHHHQGATPANGLCAQCAELLNDAHQRLENCPFGESKYACLACQISCHPDDMRHAMRAVIHYSGPRIWQRHPILALWRLLDELLLHRAPDHRSDRGKNASGNRTT